MENIWTTKCKNTYIQARSFFVEIVAIRRDFHSQKFTTYFFNVSGKSF